MDIPATQALRVLRAAGIFSSPFGTRKALPVYAEATLFDLPHLYINGGRRGLLVKIAPTVLDRLLHPQRVNVAVGT